MNQRGFTLIELLLSVAIIAIIAGTSLPFYVAFQNRNELDISTGSVVDMLRRAQNYARNGNSDSQWGVKVQAGSAVLFKGAVYTNRDTTYDEILSVPTTITPSGVGEIVFTKLAGIPSTTGNIILSSMPINDTRTVAINAKGMVNY